MGVLGCHLWHLLPLQENKYKCKCIGFLHSCPSAESSRSAKLGWNEGSRAEVLAGQLVRVRESGREASESRWVMLSALARPLDQPHTEQGRERRPG